MNGESSRKNLNILQASASKLSGFTPSIIQPEAAGRGLYARCKCTITSEPEELSAHNSRGT